MRSAIQHGGAAINYIAPDTVAAGPCDVAKFVDRHDAVLQQLRCRLVVPARAAEDDVGAAAAKDGIGPAVLWVEREEVAVTGAFTIENGGPVVAEDDAVAVAAVDVVVAGAPDNQIVADVPDDGVVPPSLRMDRVDHGELVETVTLEEGQAADQNAVTGPGGNVIVARATRNDVGAGAAVDPVVAPVEGIRGEGIGKE